MGTGSWFSNPHSHSSGTAGIISICKSSILRLQDRLPHLSPKNFLKLDDNTLKEIGFSRQKTQYARNIAEAIENGLLDLDGLANISDSTVRSELQKICGIGPWTADIYLLMALKRPDVWPKGDLALISALQNFKKLDERPTDEEFTKIGESWKPWRAVAARILWHYYLS